MSLKEFAVLMLVCLIFGLHLVVMKVTVENTAEPLFYAAMRMTIVALILSPKLKIHRGSMFTVLVAGACYGGLNYAFAFPAMGMTTASAAAVAFELYVPFSILLSVLVFKDRIGLPKITGIVLAFIGVAIIATARPDEAAGPMFFIGVAMIAAAAFAESVGAILVKKVNGIGPYQLLAWFAVVGSILLWTLSLTTENDQLQAFKGDNLVPFALALAYSALAVSLIGHASYYWLLQRLPIYIVATSGLATTLVAVLAGVFILGEKLNSAFYIGGAMTLLGIAIILWRNRDKEIAPLPET